MNLEIESFGTPLKNFETLRDELIAQNKKFGPENLAYVPYEKLPLCATGCAGKAICSLACVRQEKESRRNRFLAMTGTEIEEVQMLLHIEQMDVDVKIHRLLNHAPKWEELRPRQRAWFKLNCLINHIDNVFDRLREAQDLLQQVIETKDLPRDYTVHQLRKLESLMHLYPTSIPDSLLRAKIIEIALAIKKIMPDDEQKTCETEVLFNYSCTSDCYQPLP